MPSAALDMNAFAAVFAGFGKSGGISILGSVSAEQYVFIVLIAVFTVMISDKSTDRENLSPTCNTVLKIISNAVLLSLFVFTVFFVFPQYPQAVSPVPFTL